MHVLVVTCAHRGDDARIVHREAAALLAAGHAVTLVSAPPDSLDGDPVGLRRIAIRRSSGRHRLPAWRDLRAAVDREIGGADIMIIHDPEILVLVRRRWRSTPMLWDVHEDFVASARDRRWLPAALRPLVSRVVAHVQRRAARSMHIVIAEHSYRETFPNAPVVPNSTWVPAERPQVEVRSPPEVVYVGRLSRSRGVRELIALGDRLDAAARVVLVGQADDDVREELRAAHEAGTVEWRGPLPNPQALAVVRGALVGVSLLHGIPNYLHSMPTKLIEYMANGVPVISTPLVVAAELVELSGGGALVPFEDVDAVAAVVRELIDDPSKRLRWAEQGHRYVAEHHNWSIDGPRFADLVQTWAVGR